jgi:hypothetical protein
MSRVRLQPLLQQALLLIVKARAIKAHRPLGSGLTNLLILQVVANHAELSIFVI